MVRSLRLLATFARFGAARAGGRQAQRAAPAASPASSHSSPGASAGVVRCPGAMSMRFMSGDHTAKWMQNAETKSPMELINEVPPIKVDARVVACEGGTDPALGHPIEYISLDGAGSAVCKYCGLRYYQGDAHGHH